MRAILFASALGMIAIGCGGSTGVTAPVEDVDSSVDDSSTGDGSIGDGASSVDSTTSGDDTGTLASDSGSTTQDSAITAVDTGFDAGPGPDSGGGACGAGGKCQTGLSCCGGACKNFQNDPLNCGGCGIVCSGATSMCLNDKCAKPTCAPACTTGEICCEHGGGPITLPACTKATTCPVGCPLCN